MSIIFNYFIMWVLLSLKSSLSSSIDVEQNYLSIHQDERVYVSELIFGHLLTSSNYDDTMKKTIGGCKGHDTKLTNIFSTEFIIETANIMR
ncbi:unnamed protein product [Malus baccata var. baccata]